MTMAVSCTSMRRKHQKCTCWSTLNHSTTRLNWLWLWFWSWSSRTTASRRWKMKNYCHQHCHATAMRLTRPFFSAASILQSMEKPHVSPVSRMVTENSITTLSSRFPVPSSYLWNVTMAWTILTHEKSSHLKIHSTFTAVYPLIWLQHGLHLPNDSATWHGRANDSHIIESTTNKYDNLSRKCWKCHSSEINQLRVYLLQFSTAIPRI